jgi:hypothetical protein
VGNLAGFGAPYITGAVADATADSAGNPQYFLPMAIVGFFMLTSAVLMVLLARAGKKNAPIDGEPAVTIAH